MTLRPAIVLGGDVNGLGQVRALGRAGILVNVICAHRSEPAAHSKYASAIVVPKGGEYEARLVNAIISLSRPDRGPVPLFASSDAFVEFIARNRDRLSESCILNIVDDDTLFMVTDKIGSHDLAVRCGIRAPSLVPLAEFSDDRSLVDRFGYPALVKPRDSYTVAFPWKNFTAHAPADLEKVLDTWPELVPYALVQEIIPGPESGIYQCNVYIGKDVPTQFCTVQKLHQQPVGFGTMSFGRTRWNPPLVEETARLLESVGYTGFASVEFKQSSADGHFYLIEINPRLPWYNSLFAASGINFALLAYRDLTGVEPEQVAVVEQIDDVYWLHLRNELRGAVERARRGQWSAAARELAGLWRSRAFGLFSVTDPLPFVVGYANYVRDFAATIRRKFAAGS
ncbi:hypothetical protein [Thioalkalivibrio sp. XN279]|uniref:carboxylate--amine ligase n=1 Tax=Thioalkalivibrio sp. XN279 TaxID=2714953 RepID=UPI00140A9E5C|nr:hypothetical protein [Thioalkalivibrio sp. XN279]NHA15356.1 hypothetical protein [Thioalkalivibrio sp. XN279]